jgi:CBS domain-containing protein
MKTDVECCRTDTAISDVAQRMKTENIGFMPVCDNNDVVIGTITDRDIVMRVLADGRDVGSTTAGDVMTHEVVSCSPDDDVDTASELMAEHQKSRMIVCDGSNRVIGVISLSDVAKSQGDHASFTLSSIARREAHP